MNIKMLSYIDLAILGCILIWCTIVCLRNREQLFGKRSSHDTVIRQPRLYCYVAVYSLAILIFGFAFCIFDIRNYESKKYFETIILAQFTFLPIGIGLYLLFLSMNWKICLYKDHFTHTNTLGITRAYRYDEILVKALRAVYRYYRKGHFVLSISYLQHNCNALTKAIDAYLEEQTYSLPKKQNSLDFDVLRQEEEQWERAASVKDKIIYVTLSEKLKKDTSDVYIADYIVGVKDKDIFPIFEDILLSWEDKKMQAITAYIIGNKENKKAYCIILQAYLCLSWEEKKRYASLYDKAIGSTITKEVLMADPGWLSDWHTAFNLPKTMRKIAKWELPVVNGIWIGILKQKNTYDREYYDLEEAKETLLPLVKRRVKD